MNKHLLRAELVEEAAPWDLSKLFPDSAHNNECYMLTFERFISIFKIKEDCNAVTDSSRRYLV